jgi:DNA-directed RNA polymerase alpha subunit
VDRSFPNLAAPAMRALASAGIDKLEDVASLTETELKKLHGMGPNAIAKLKDAMSDRGLTFADE